MIRMESDAALGQALNLHLRTLLICQFARPRTTDSLSGPGDWLFHGQRTHLVTGVKVTSHTVTRLERYAV